MATEMTVIPLPNAATIANRWIKTKVGASAYLGDSNLVTRDNSKLAIWKFRVCAHGSNIGYVVIDARTCSVLMDDETAHVLADRVLSCAFLSDEEMQQEASDLIRSILESEVDHGD